MLSGRICGDSDVITVLLSLVIITVLWALRPAYSSGEKVELVPIQPGRSRVRFGGRTRDLPPIVW